MTAIVYHRVDWDGYTSAAVALRVFPDADLIGWSYGDPEPEVSSYDRVIVVDLSLSEDWMTQNASKLIWIDHHANAIAKLLENAMFYGVYGIRRDGIGACALAWEYFFPNEPIPAHIRFVATADVMDRTLCLAPLHVALSYGLYLDTFGPGWSKETGDVSKKLVNEALRLLDDFDCFEGLCEGAGLEQTRAAHENELFLNAKDIKINNYNVCILPTDARPNACILSHLLNNTHDAFICIGDEVSPGVHKISLRIPQESDFDASAFCRQYGGNGHIKAAGCLMTDEQLDALINL